MQSIIVTTGFCEPGITDLLYSALKAENAKLQFVKGSEIYRKLILEYGNQNEMSQKYLLMAAQQLTMAQVWQAVKDGTSVFVDLSWVPKCIALPTDLGKLKKRAKTKMLWLQGTFKNVEQYKQGMRACRMTTEYRYLFAKNIRDGHVWLLKQGIDYQALYYDKIPVAGMEIPWGVQTGESVNELCKSVVSVFSIK